MCEMGAQSYNLSLIPLDRSLALHYMKTLCCKTINCVNLNCVVPLFGFGIVPCKLMHYTVYQYCTYFNFSEVHTMKVRTVWMSKGLILLWSFRVTFCTALKFDPNEVCVVRMIPFHICC